MTDEEHADRIARIRADRAAIGREPFITSPVVYRLLAAVVTDRAPQQN